VLIPILYLKGVSTGDFEEALTALLGKDAGGLSASTIARLKEAWVDEHARWRNRDLSADLTGLFWTKRCEKMCLERSLGDAEEKVQCGADCDAASPD
jgi:hypothetical protein